VLEYQWDQVVVPFWKEIDQLAADSGVTVAIEMHPQNVVFNPPTLRRLVERTGATNVGAEMDPSHLFWQGMDPIAAVEYLGDLVVHAAAKDVRINSEYARIYGVLDERFRRLAPEETRSASADTSSSMSGPRTRPGTSWRWDAATMSTSGRGSSTHCVRWTRTWRSTSSTRTPHWAGIEVLEIDGSFPSRCGMSGRPRFVQRAGREVALRHQKRVPERGQRHVRAPPI
jgi:hypothetical protein